MIHVFACITARPGQRDKVLALFRENRPKVLAEAGCIAYEATVDVPEFGAPQTPLGPDTFAVVERWADGAALKAHGAAPHMVEYGSKTRDLVERRVIHVLQAC